MSRKEPVLCFLSHQKTNTFSTVYTHLHHNLYTFPQLILLYL